MPPGDVTLTLESTDLETGQIHEYEIPSSDIIGPVVFKPERFNHINLYCMYAVHSGGFEDSGKYDPAAYEQHVRISNQCLGLGAMPLLFAVGYSWVV